MLVHSISLFSLILCSIFIVWMINRFLFPALGGVLFGYDIGATCGAQISLEVGYAHLTYASDTFGRSEVAVFFIIILLWY